MTLRTLAVLTVLATVGLSVDACHDGAGKRTETTQIRITGTPKAGHVAPARHQPEKPADEAAPATGSKGRSGVGAGSTASQES
ncbi:hypothetical protein [Brevundimonas goettingensis]|uniref:Uncharacterized protein n=1 Tax=Brevundimonas goettingensis TaxID=2774190 RepID=A0A975C593_9CAUL|nr:hypothetical protein [Brevundimonas goettingensis]QTC92704.1 hypothetical protein IFJ75_07545 [Brevundimonas goettingensis]